LKKAAAGRADANDVTAALDEADAKYLAVEDRLLHPSIAEGDLKSFRGAMGLYLKWLWLQAEVGTGGGDVFGNSDFRPTQPQQEVYDLMAGQMDAMRAALKTLDEEALPKLEQWLRDRGVGRFLAPPPAPAGGRP
jgi:hypothetical protein